MGEISKKYQSELSTHSRVLKETLLFFSTVYGENENCTFIDNNKNLMNVAVSRAKDAFWVFGSINCLKKKANSSASGLMYRYISNYPLHFS